MPGEAGGKAVMETDDHHATASQVETKQASFRSYAKAVLFSTVLVIVFGAFVRASLSGDGCGVSWPSCGGVLFPDGSSTKTVIEFTHRATSGVLLLMTIGLYFWARNIFDKSSVVRKASFWVLALTIGEALIGMLLVRYGWVVGDKSTARAVAMPIHLVNTYALMAALALAAAPRVIAEEIKFRGQGVIGWALGLTAFGSLVMAGTGALSALGKTAFDAELKAAQTLSGRIDLHIGEGAHPLLKGGVAHPLLAISIVLLILGAVKYVSVRRSCPEVTKWGRYTALGFIGQLILGAVNLLMSAPVIMQLLHLAAAVFVWVTFGIMAIHTLKVSDPLPDSKPKQIDEPAAGEKRGAMSIIGDYVALTKPRVISLLLFTTVLAMYLPNGAWPAWHQVLLVAIGGYLAAGSANAFNMVLERDLDLAMERTASRPTVAQRVSVKNALIFAVLAEVASFAILTMAANVLSAVLALAGLIFYVLVYTMVLKRRTWQNIVIGGAAGAFPPLVGWAAVTNSLNPYAWMLFALIFVWTPVHFWALAILIKEDYAKAGVPMLPVVKGERSTVIQIAVYAVLTAIVSIIPLFQNAVGLTYIIGAGVLNFVLVAQSIQLVKHPDKKHAKVLFKYSMAYLALMFIVLAVDRGLMA
jgi:protoheme IX farnesyltransferase